MRPTPALLTILLLLSACGEQETKSGLSAEEERRLDNAAKMLDEGPGNLTFDSAPESEGNANGDAAAIGNGS